MVTVQPKPKRANGVALAWLEQVAVPFAGDNCLPWPFQRNHLGRPVFKMDYHTVYASRVVCEKVNGPPPTAAHVAAHSCGQGHDGCVNPRHLWWATRKENSDEMVDHGTRQRGETHPNSKLQEAEAREIKQLVRAGASRRTLAARFGVSKAAVDRIAQGRNWAWL